MLHPRAPATHACTGSWPLNICLANATTAIGGLGAGGTCYGTCNPGFLGSPRVDCNPSGKYWFRERGSCQPASLGGALCALKRRRGRGRGWQQELTVLGRGCLPARFGRICTAAHDYPSAQKVSVLPMAATLCCVPLCHYAVCVGPVPFNATTNTVGWNATTCYDMTAGTNCTCECMLRGGHLHVLPAVCSVIA